MRTQPYASAGMRRFRSGSNSCVPPNNTGVIIRPTTPVAVAILSPVVVNANRRVLVLSGAVDCLASGGMKALTHRGVDRAADLPLGTTANYFPTRSALVEAVAQHVSETLALDTRSLDRVRTAGAAHERLATYVDLVIESMLRRPGLSRALLELRLESVRNPRLAAREWPFRMDAVVADPESQAHEFWEFSYEVELLQHAIEGLMLEALTLPRPGLFARTRARNLVDRLVPRVESASATARNVSSTHVSTDAYGTLDRPSRSGGVR